MIMASSSLHIDSNPFEAIDSGRFTEAQTAIDKNKTPKPLTSIAVAELALYFGRLSDAETALNSAGPVSGDIWLASRFALAEGELLFARQDFSIAKKRFNAAFHFSEFLGDQFSVALAVYRMSRILSAEGHQEEAIRMLHEAYEGLRGLGAKAEFMRGLLDFQLAVCELRSGHIAESEQLYRSAIDSLKESERGRYYALVLISHGIVQRQSGNLAQAQESFEEAMNLLSRQNIFGDLASCISELSTVLIRMLSYDRAERLLTESLDLYKRIENTDGEARSLTLLAQIELERNRPRKVREYAQRAFELSDPVKAPQVAASARIQLARSSALEKDRARSVELLEEALKIAEGHGFIEQKIEAHIYLAELYHGFDPLKGPGHLEAAGIILKEHNNPSIEAEWQRVSQKYQSGRIWREGSKLIFDSNLLPNWYEAKKTLEVFLLKGALAQTGQNLTEAGKLLGISKVHVHDKRKQYQI